MSAAVPTDPRTMLEYLTSAAGAIAGWSTSEPPSRFEQLLASITARFINLQPDEVDAAIEGVQKFFCESLGLDRSGLWQFSANGELLLTHLHQLADGPQAQRHPDAASGLDVYWLSIEGSAGSSRLDVEALCPWMARRVRDGQTTAVCSLEDIPEEGAKDRHFLNAVGTKSTVIIPLSVGGARIGCLSFASARQQRNWTEGDVARFGAIAPFLTREDFRSQ